MAIDRVKRLDLLAPAYISRPLIQRLYQLDIIHVTDVFHHHPTARGPLRRPDVTKHDTEERIQKLQSTIGFLLPFLQRKKSFIEGFFPVPIPVRKEELERLLSSFDMDALYEECKTTAERLRTIETRLRDIQEEVGRLEDFSGLPWPLETLRAIKKVIPRLGTFLQEDWRRFSLDPRARELLVWQVVPTADSSGRKIPSKNKDRKVLVAYLPKDKEGAEKLLEAYNFKELPLPELMGRVEERVLELESQKNSLRETEGLLRKRMTELAEHSSTVEILLGYWESEKERLNQESNFALSQKLLLATGYIRIRDIPRLEELVEREYPQCSVLYEDPSTEENIPVSLRLSSFFRPAQFLVNMFGLPNYFTFDPTPYIILNFLFFFGICFGDVVYGLGLMGLSCWMMRRFKLNPNLRNFFKLFFYAGVSTTLCGALTGGWAGDLYKPEYLGEGNLLLRLKERLVVLDPLSDVLVGLTIVLGLGILNQFYALSLRMYKDFRRGRPIDALLDGGLWLIFLPGLVILTSTMFLTVSPGLINLGKVLAILGLLGLVLTQGRKEEGLGAKIITGIVSIYGILGSYGSTSFVSDILSYSRLLALGLTTSIIAMSFNIVAGIVSPQGTVFFVLVLVLGHLLNFFISIIGSFVHPARLIFLEFFGRFYEAGAVRFRPFGFSSERISLIT